MISDKLAAVPDAFWHVMEYVGEGAQTVHVSQLSSSLDGARPLRLLPPNVAGVCKAWSQVQTEKTNQKTWEQIPNQAKLSACYVLSVWEKKGEFSPEAKQYLLESMVGRYLAQFRNKTPERFDEPLLDKTYKQYLGFPGYFTSRYVINTMCGEKILGSNMRERFKLERSEGNFHLSQDELLHKVDAESSFFSEVTALDLLDYGYGPLDTALPPEVRLFINLQSVYRYSLGPIGPCWRAVSPLWCERFPKLTTIAVQCLPKTTTDPTPNVPPLESARLQAISDKCKIDIILFASVDGGPKCEIPIRPRNRKTSADQVEGRAGLKGYFAPKSFIHCTHPALLLAYTAIFISLLASTLYLYSAESKR